MPPILGRCVLFLVCVLASCYDLPAAGISPERIKLAVAELEKLTQQTLKKTGVPGVAIAVVCNDEVVFLKGFGIRQVGKNDAVDADTVFQLASVSKPVASTVIAALVGEKVVRWDDRIVDHDPSFAMYQPWVTSQVTIRDFLCHRSGLPDHGGDLLEDLGFPRQAVLHQMRELKPASSFRSQFAYTNFGYSEAALAAALAAGKPWEELALEKVYRPLGMKSTSSRYADFTAAKNRAVLHARIDGQWEAKYTRDADAQSPAGGVSSSARDLAQWMRLQLGGGKVDGQQIVAADALAETHRAQIVNRPQENPESERSGFYGLGWNVNYDDQGRVRLGHSGGFELGASTVVNLIPAEHLGILVLANAAPGGVPESLARSFCDLALTGQVERDWLPIFRQALASNSHDGAGADEHQPITNKLPPLTNSAYVGNYANHYYGNLEVVEQQGSLALRIGPKPLTFDLRHYNRDVFLYQPRGEMAAGPSAVTFTVGPDAKAAQVTLENLNIDGQGTFIRATKPRP